MQASIRTLLTITALVVALTVTSGASSVTARRTTRTGCRASGPGAQYHPAVDPADFGPNVDNRWFPLTPGTTLHVHRDQGRSSPPRESVTITGRTARDRRGDDRVSSSIVCSSPAGSPSGRVDYYAQDDDGNVWYFGEDTVALGRPRATSPTREGSFHAGVDGAQPGVFMQAHPQIGRRFRQEWYAGPRRGQLRVLVELATTVTVPFGIVPPRLAHRGDDRPRTRRRRQQVLRPRHRRSRRDRPSPGPLEKLQLVAVAR